MKIKDYLESKGIEVEYDGGYFYKCNFKGNKVYLQRNDAFNSCFSLYVNKNIVMSRALLRTCIGKILNLKEIEEKIEVLEGSIQPPKMPTVEELENNIRCEVIK